MAAIKSWFQLDFVAGMLTHVLLFLALEMEMLCMLAVQRRIWLPRDLCIRIMMVKYKLS